MQVELHPLVPGSVPALGHGDLFDGVGLQHQLPVVPADSQLAEDTQIAAGLVLFGVGPVDRVQNGPGLALLHPLVDADGAGMVRHVEADHPGLGLGQLPVVHGKDLALHAGLEHIHVQIPHGGGLVVEGLAEDHLLVLPGRGGLGLGGGGRGAALQGRLAQGLGVGKELLVGHLMAGDQRNVQRPLKAGGEIGLRRAQMGAQLLGPVGLETELQPGVGDYPGAAGHGAAGQGIFRGDKADQVGVIHLRQHVGGIPGLQGQRFEPVALPGVLCRLLQGGEGQIGVALQLHHNGLLPGAQIYMAHPGSGKLGLPVLRQVQGWKEIKQGDIVFHG